MRCLNAYEIATRNATSMYKTQKFLKQKDIYTLEVSKFTINTVHLSYQLNLTNF